MKCVKMLLSGSALVLCLFAVSASAQTSVAAPAVAVAKVAAPSVAPEPAVPVAEPAAPPKWAQDLLVQAEKLPVVGPIISKALVYAGILVSVLTAIVAFLLTLLSAVSGIAGLSGLAAFASKIQAFKDGKIMYWLKYLSMFNAQKPVVAAAGAPAEDKKAS
jgi:hypothetical protein